MDLRKKQGLGASIVAMLMVCGPALAVQPVVSVSAEGGFRVDNATISGRDSGSTTANINWNELTIAQTKFNVDAAWDNIQVNGFFTYGMVVGGESDALSSSDNLTREAWFGDADGDVQDIGVSIGYRLHVVTVDHRHTYIMPTLGYNFSKQNYEDGVNARATNTTAGSFDGPQRGYAMEWDGFSLGVSLWEADMSRDFTIGISFEYLIADFFAKADWERPDLGESAYRRPASFEQKADASGYRTALTGSYGIGTSLDFVFSLEYQLWETDAGIQRSNTVINTEDSDLNKVEWNSTALNLGVSYLF